MITILRTRLRRFATYFGIIGLVLFGVVHSMPAAALAQAQLHPGFFALPASDFPAGSHVVRAGVEGNRRLVNDDVHHFGLPPAAFQRLTGYYMNAVEGDLAGQHAYTSYLVSIFHTRRQARLAFDERWDTWFAANYNTTPPAAPVTVGDAGAEALFHTLDPNQPALSELMFQRGSVLVEVFQGTVTAAPTDIQRHAFWTVAAHLDALAAQHPHGI